MLWLPYGRATPVKLEVRSDFVSALSLVTHLKTSGKATKIIAREVALVLGECTYMPSVYSYVQGVRNDIADSLSRRFSPDFEFALLSQLSRAREDTPTPRVKAWWTSSHPPASQQVKLGRMLLAFV